MFRVEALNNTSSGQLCKFRACSLAPLREQLPGSSLTLLDLSGCPLRVKVSLTSRSETSGAFSAS